MMREAIWKKVELSYPYYRCLKCGVEAAGQFKELLSSTTGGLAASCDEPRGWAYVPGGLICLQCRAKPVSYTTLALTPHS